MKRKNQSQHDRMVAMVAEYLRANGHTKIKADLPQFSKPEVIKWKGKSSGHIPDISSWNGHLWIFEVETTDSISDDHTRDQWQLFSASAQLNGYSFVIVVPSGYESVARQRVSTLKVEAHGIWTT